MVEELRDRQPRMPIEIMKLAAVRRRSWGTKSTSARFAIRSAAFWTAMMWAPFRRGLGACCASPARRLLDGARLSLRYVLEKYLRIFAFERAFRAPSRRFAMHHPAIGNRLLAKTHSQ